ncbi:MAG: transporter substrate-binding domain-containing protein [Clostridium butyricum]|nr:transporter substrate-binding domain-containing protein [Clostridium butyricum]
MMKKRIISTLMVSILSLGLFTGCGSADSDAANNSNGGDKKYIIACDAKYAPFSFEEDGKYKGIDVELLEAIAKQEGFEYELKPMDFSAIIPGLTANQLDGAIAGMSITDERKQSLDFSDSYFESGLSLVVNANNTEINGQADLQDKSAAIKKGTAGSQFAEDNQEKYNLQLNYFDDSPTMFLDVENGNSDFLIEDYPVIGYKIKVDGNSKLKIAGEKLTTANYGFAVNKGENAELLQKFNDGLKKLKENGEYDKIIGQYIGQ